MTTHQDPTRTLSSGLAQRGVCYREGFAAKDYEDAIDSLRRAFRQRLSMVQGKAQSECAVCGDSDHTAEQCHHDPLILARKWTHASGVWSCWHCGFTATNEKEAREHFGSTEDEIAKCIADKATAEITTLRARVAELEERTPKFDAISVDQERLAIQFCEEIAGPRGGRPSPPDPVRLLEMARALYEAEMRDIALLSPSQAPMAANG